MTDDALAALAERHWQHLLSRTPYLQMRRGITVEHLPAGSLEEAQADADHGTALLAELDAIDVATLADTDRVTHALLQDQAQTAATAVEDWWADFPVTPYSQFFASMALQQILPAVDLATDGDRFIALVEDLATAITTIRHKTEQMAQRGWVLPAPAFDGAIATFTGLRAGTEALFDREAPDPLAGRIAKVRDEVVLPAYDELLGLLHDPTYRDTAPEGVGLSQYPDGEEAYLRLLRMHATFDITPEEVQRRGIEQMAELSEAKAAIRAQVGVADEAAFLAWADEQGRLRAPSPEWVEETYQRHIARIEPHIGEYFSVLPAAPYGVKRLDEALEAGMSYGYYEPPNASEPIGRYRYNGSGLDTRNQLNAAALIFHELVPGHHFHIARQAESDLPAFRAESLFYAAFTEGWAEYAAALAGEMGMYTDPVDAYGRLVHESFLACRLVVDPGMNVMGMSLAEARAYLADNCVESTTQIGTETLRYSTDIPGQALGYRLGHNAFERLRGEASAALGDAFDIRDFHEVVLGQGARPMTVVSSDVRRWIVHRGTRA